MLLLIADRLCEGLVMTVLCVLQGNALDVEKRSSTDGRPQMFAITLYLTPPLFVTHAIRLLKFQNNINVIIRTG